MARFSILWTLLVACAAAPGVGCHGVPKLEAGGGPSVPVLPEIVAPAPTPPPASALGVAPGAPPPGPETVWSKLGLSAEQREFRRRKLCETPGGKLIGFATAPVSKLSLGLIPPFCPGGPTLQQLLDKGAIGAASKVKMDKMNAKKRKKAVEALKDVDCHYWPEAEEALIAALRTDRNEAVRYTAAKTLFEGKCCTVKTIEALSIAASGSDRDGAPCEVSEAVRAQAAKALKKCLEYESCLNRCGTPQNCAPAAEAPTERPREEEPPRAAPMAVVPATVKPGPPAPDRSADPDPGVRLVAYYERVRQRPADRVIAAARDVLTRVAFPVGAENVPAGHPDYEAVELYPEVATAASPRPVGLFERPSPATGVSPGAARPRDPSRPANILDMLAAPASAPQPAAAPVPSPMPPATPTPAPAVVVPVSRQVPAVPPIPMPMPAAVPPTPNPVPAPPPSVSVVPTELPSPLPPARPDPTPPATPVPGPIPPVMPTTGPRAPARPLTLPILRPAILVVEREPWRGPVGELDGRALVAESRAEAP